MVRMTNYYDVLGVEKRASLAEIKRAYRALAKQHHPDRCPPEQKAEAEARFKKIAEAYYVLGNVSRRQQYDADRRGRRHAVDPASGFDFHAFMRGSHHGRPSDWQVFEGLVNEGLGAARFSTNGRWPTADTVNTDVETNATLTQQQLAQGTSMQLTTPDGQTLTVKVPRTMRDGQRLRLKGQGQPCPCCSKRGDLYLALHIHEQKGAPHDDTR